MLQDLPPSPHLPMLLVWVVRTPAELLVLAPRVMAAAREKGVALTVKLHYTGGGGLYFGVRLSGFVQRHVMVVPVAAAAAVGLDAGYGGAGLHALHSRRADQEAGKM